MLGAPTRLDAETIKGVGPEGGEKKAQVGFDQYPHMLYCHTCIAKMGVGLDTIERHTAHCDRPHREVFLHNFLGFPSVRRIAESGGCCKKT